MNEFDIKKAPTRDKVFLKSQSKILNAIEDVALSVSIDESIIGRKLMEFNVQ